MKVFIILFAVLAVSFAQNYPDDESPKPYSFSYVAEGEEGTSSHSETADGSGTVRGTYSLTDMDGRNRVVEYVAGPEGYNANVRTNEPGTVNANPADVTMESTAEGADQFSALSAGQYTRPSPARQPEARPVAPSANRGGSGRFVLVPSDDPRARSYYGQS